MKKTVTPTLLALAVATGLLALTEARTPAYGASSAQQFPVMDAIADKVIQRYKGSSCEELWLERAQKQGQPKSAQVQQAISVLRSNPQMRDAFINKVAAPIASKLFDCGMIP